MSELEKEAIQYAEDFCNQVHNVDLNMMRDYAKTDFIAGAEWQKLKQKDMVEILKKVSDYLKEYENKNYMLKLMSCEFSSPIDELIKEATKL